MNCIQIWRTVLDEADFRDLVKGRPIKVSDGEIVLGAIEAGRMKIAIDDAIAERLPPTIFEPHDPEGDDC